MGSGEDLVQCGDLVRSAQACLLRSGAGTRVWWVCSEENCCSLHPVLGRLPRARLLFHGGARSLLAGTSWPGQNLAHGCLGSIPRPATALFPLPPFPVLLAATFGGCQRGGRAVAA